MAAIPVVDTFDCSRCPWVVVPSSTSCWGVNGDSCTDSPSHALGEKMNLRFLTTATGIREPREDGMGILVVAEFVPVEVRALRAGGGDNPGDDNCGW